MMEHLSGHIIIKHLSLIHHNNAVHISGHILHAVRYQDHRHAGFLPELCDLIQDLIPALRIQARRGLVQHKHLRLHCQNSCNGNSSLLSPGKIKGRLIKVLILQPHLLQRRISPKLGFLLIQSHILRAKAYIRIHIHLKKLMLRVLKHKSYLAS